MSEQNKKLEHLISEKDSEIAYKDIDISDLRSKLAISI